MDNPAVPRVSNRGRTVSVRDSRSRCYLLEGCGSLVDDDRNANSENTRAVTASQCFLRTAHRYHSPGMFGLHDSAQWIACANDPEKLGGSLQSRTPTLEPGTRNTGGCHFSEHEF